MEECMSPEALKRAHDWIEVREDLLSRVRSLDPKIDTNERNIRPMFTHLLLALRRATITLIRVITDGRAIGCGETAGADHDRGCFMWRGTNYLAKICEDTAFLENMDGLQRYFGVTFRDNPLVAERTLSGLDARVHSHDSSPRRVACDAPARRWKFFAGLDHETEQFVHGVLRDSQKRQQEEDRYDRATHCRDPYEGCLESPYYDMAEEATCDANTRITQKAGGQGGEGRGAVEEEEWYGEVGERRAVGEEKLGEVAEQKAIEEGELGEVAEQKTVEEKGGGGGGGGGGGNDDEREQVEGGDQQWAEMKDQETEGGGEAGKNQEDERKREGGGVGRGRRGGEDGNEGDTQGLQGVRPPTEQKQGRTAKPGVNMTLVHEFATRVKTRQREGAFLLASRAFLEWSSLAARLGETRAKVNHRFEQRQRVREVAYLRGGLVCLKKNVSEKTRVRELATAMMERRQTDATRGVLAALAKNVERSRSRDRSARLLRNRLDAAQNRRDKTRVLAALARACEEGIVLLRKAEDMRNDGLVRLSIEAFSAWARAAGLARRLRKRLCRADKALLENVMRAWALFSTHSAERRLRKKNRTARRARLALAQGWDTEALDEAFFNWANLTAAGKFYRLRLSARALRGWAATARALASGAGGSAVNNSRRSKGEILVSARSEANARFERLTRRRLADIFECWARGAGLASRLRRKLGETEMSLIRNAFCGWELFARHSLAKREARLAARETRRRDAHTLREVLWAWSDVTAAEKFFRVRLGHQVLKAWRDAVLAGEQIDSSDGGGM